MGVGSLIAAVAIPGAACRPADRAAGDGTAAQPADSATLLADRLLETLGGREAWEGTRFLAFHWIVARDGEVVRDRAHSWDRHGGRYRLEFEQDGSTHTAIFNVNELRSDSILGKVPAGGVWLDGQPLAGVAQDSALARAYGSFINDTYWLLMPFKWRDPGVHLVYEGRRTLDDGREYDTVNLRFDVGLGVTEDQYWGFLDPETGRLAAWQYHLENQEEPGALIRWEDWQPVGSLQLAARRRWPDGQIRIYFEGLAAGEEVPDGAFDPPGF